MYALYHHGIRGMHWGLRNGPPYPLGTNAHSPSEVRAGWRKSLAKGSPSADILKNGNSYNTGKTGAKVSGGGIERSKSNSQNAEKMTHRQKLEAKYRAQGLSAAEARAAAEKRIKTEKILAATVGITVATAAAYVAFKHYNQSVDKIIKQGAILKRIENNADKSVHDAFYAATNKSDANKYFGFYGRSLKNRAPDKSVFQKTIKAKSEMKIASDKNAQSLLSKLYSEDKKFASDLDDLFRRLPRPLDQKGGVNHYNAKKAIEKGVVDKSVYERFNRALVNYNNPAVKRYYQYLREKGYDGLRDINDRKYSGYNARNPVIIINKGKAVVDRVEEKLFYEIQQQYEREKTKQFITNTARQVTPYAVATGGIVGVTYLSSDRKEKSQ